MAILSNVNGKFAVDSTGAIQFSGSAGTSGYILRSNGNAAPTWVDSSTVIGGPYLPLAGGTLTGATATATGISFTVGGNLFVTGTSTLTGALSGAGATFSGTITGQANNNTFGTASASGRPLTVQGNSSGQTIRLKNTLGGDGTIFATGTATSMNYSFSTYSTSNALFIQNDGNVGIGTDSPTSPTSVGTFLEIRGRNGIGGGTAGIVLKDYDNDGWDIWNSGGQLNFRYNNDGAVGFFITSAGNTTFAGNVTVGANTVQNGTNPGLKIQSTNISQTVLGLHNTTSGNWEVAVGGSANTIGAGKFYVYDNTADAGRLVIDTSGNAMIGGTSTFNGVTGETGFEIYGDTAQLLINNPTYNHFTIYSASDSNIYNVFGSSGNYLIGTGNKDTSSWSEKMRITSGGQLQLQGSSSSIAKSTTQTEWAYIPGSTNATLMSQNPSGMSSASAGYHIVYGANNSSPYESFIDVITYMCGSSTSVTTISSTNLSGSPGSRSYSKNSSAVILNISGSADYNCNVKTTFINYTH